jgi:hypothetical protein
MQDFNMKYVKLFEQFIKESGNAINDAQPINQEDVIPTAEWVAANVFPEIGLGGLGDDAAIIGSAGKKKADQTSGDIDIAVSADKIAGYLGSSVENVIYALNDKLKSMGYATDMRKGFNQVSIGAPIAGDSSKGTAQIDLMLSSNLEWSKFMYHAPDFRIDESRYKGAHRNLLLMAAMSNSFRKILKTTEKGETVEYEAYVIRLNQGVVQVRKTFQGKKGLKKTDDLLREYDKFITNTPQEVVNLLFNGNHTPSDLDTYEKVKSLLDSADFKYPEVLSAIFADFKGKVEDAKLPLPSDIG